MTAKAKTKKKRRETQAVATSENIEAKSEVPITDERVVNTPQQDEPLSGLKIDTVYLITQNGLEGYFGPEAQDLVKQIQNDDDTPYIFYNPKPFYIAIQNGSIEPLTFPEPERYGTTSASLFAMAVTCADAIAEFIRLKIKGKQGLAGQLRQLGMLGMPLVIAIFLIFILAVYIGGK